MVGILIAITYDSNKFFDKSIAARMAFFEGNPQG